MSHSVPSEPSKSNHSTPTSSQNREKAAVMMQSSGITWQTSDALGASERAKNALLYFSKTCLCLMRHLKEKE